MYTCNDIALPKTTTKRSCQNKSVNADQQRLAALQRDSTELQLVKLLQQHRHTLGWIVLVAPAIKPNKAFWAACQLPLDKILVVHEPQIKNIAATLNQALANTSSKVVINCAPLNENDLRCLTEQAIQRQSRFYSLHDALVAAH